MVRKTVTLVFCDVADSTPLGELFDPEALRGVWSRYHETARAVLERHGGTVEKFVGDAVLGVFGIPVVHEDDALRAVRAAVELRGELKLLNDELEAAFGVRIGVRTGVHTGEVYAGDPAQGDPFATGDAVVVAQRLEATATAGEILVGDATIRLVRDAVTVEPVPALELKGKSEPVDAWLLLDVAPDVAGVARRMDSPLVGRVAELEALLAELERVVSDRSCRIVTIVGEPGVGKSRLAAELIATGGEDVLVLEGRCLPYGNGITYWPLVEMVRDLDLDEVLGREPDGEVVHERILEAVGRAESRSRSDELYWAIRRLLETLARERPLVLVLDDIQWAEPAFLDLVEYLAGWSRDAPILVCCIARPDLAELRPAWTGTTIQLAPLRARRGAAAARASRRAARSGCGRGDRPRDGGNPLFLEEMLRMLVEDGLLVERDGRLQALTEVDSLRVPARCRRCSRRGSTCSTKRSWRCCSGLPSSARCSCGARSPISLRPTDQRPRPPSAGARPEAVDQARRANLRRRGWLPLRPHPDSRRRLRLDVQAVARRAARASRRLDRGSRDGRSDLDEIIGHHLERAYGYRTELAPAGEAEASLADRATTWLVRAGRRALTRGDAFAASGLLGRAAALNPMPDVLLDLAEAQMQLGQVAEAEHTFGRAVEGAVAAGDEKSVVRARLGLGRIGFLSRGELRIEDFAAEVARALPAFEAAGDDATVARLLSQLAEAYCWRCQIVPMQDALERALALSRRAGDERLEAYVAVQFGFAAIVGPLPVDEGRRSIARTVEHMTEDTSAKGMLLLISALLAAMAGDFTDARALAARGTEILDSLGRSVGLAAVSTWTSAIDLLAGDAGAAERALRDALAQLEQAGQVANLASVAAQLAETLVADGRYEEAARFAAMSERAAASDDIHAQIAWRVARAKASAGLGASDRAEVVAREAVDLATTKTDSPFFAAEALEALAAALVAAGRPADAQVAARDALELYEAKGNVVAAERVRTGRAAGRTASTPG